MSSSRWLDRTTRRRFTTWLAAAAGGTAMPGWLTAGEAGVADATELLADAVALPDPAAGFERTAEGSSGGGRWVCGTLTSQEWRGVLWQHEMCVYRPQRATGGAGPMVLWIDGGNKKEMRRARASGGPSSRLAALAAVAELSGLPAAVVRQVPFQPIEGRTEDDLIAHSFEKFMQSGDPTWPLLVPMVKAAAAAMTASAGIAADELEYQGDGFVVTGASKRGWTTWLSAAADRRVRGIVPMVIDMLDMPRHMALQMASFGAPSRSIVDYTKRGIQDLLDTPRGRELVALVDPFSYLQRLTQPKLVLLGTNDPYWPLEAANLYLPRLAGPRWVSYLPNATHGLPPEQVVPTVAAMGRHASGDDTLPDFDWSFSRAAAASEVVVKTDRPPTRAWLWTADSATRDFRPATWEQRPLAVAGGGDGPVTVGGGVARPTAGLRALLAQCEFGPPGGAFRLSSAVDVLAAETVDVLAAENG
jgi:PhoPQ-activated pathogenicity-related protein